MRACVDTPVDVFFTEGTPPRDVMDMCRGCDERIPCGQETLTLSNHEDHGFRAGMTPRARRTLRERRRKPAAPLGAILGNCLECDRPLVLEFPERHDEGERLTADLRCSCGTVHDLTVTLTRRSR